MQDSSVPSALDENEIVQKNMQTAYQHEDIPIPLIRLFISNTFTCLLYKMEIITETYMHAAY